MMESDPAGMEADVAVTPRGWKQMLGNSRGMEKKSKNEDAFTVMLPSL